MKKSITVLCSTILLTSCAGYVSGPGPSTDEYGNPKPVATSSTAVKQPTTATKRPSPLVVTQTSIGDVLADKASGKTLYTFAKDTKLNPRCYEACASAWPPFYSNSEEGVNAEITAVKRRDGRFQWALKGQPLYFWAGDSSPGDTNGDAIPEWKAARP